MPTQEEVAEMFPAVIWHGRYFSTTCPYHDSSPQNPSFLVYPDGAVCLTASCRKKVSLSQLAHHLSHHTPPTLERPTANLYWNRLPDPETLSNLAHAALCAHPELGQYLQERGVAPMIGPAQLGWWEGWYTFPCYNRQRRFTGLVLRAGPSLQQYAGRYVTPPGQKPLLYCPDWKLVEKADKVYVPFGIFDALTLALLGLPAIAPTNVAAATAALFSDFRRTLIVVPDAGEIEAGRQLVNGLDWRGRLAPLPNRPPYKDPNDFLKGGQAKLLLRSLTH